jgi:hypothetical protein
VRSPAYSDAVQYYEAFSDLAGVHLEDSWVLELAPSDDGLALRLEAVLTPEHPLYEPPMPGEHHCYRTAWLSVHGEHRMEVHLSGSRPAVDATGEVDFGNVDTFAFNQSEDRWELEGDWGRARVRSPEVTLRFD